MSDNIMYVGMYIQQHHVRQLLKPSNFESIKLKVLIGKILRGTYNVCTYILHATSYVCISAEWK
jgi:hypothetical protein